MMEIQAPKPPLQEVVCGLHFRPLRSYTAVNAAGLFDLFKEDYPEVKSQPPIQNQDQPLELEPNSSITLTLKPDIFESRLWFLSETKSHLLQFQQDRFLLNWRPSEQDEDYPGGDKIISEFERQLERLQDFVHNDLKTNLAPTNLEVTYIDMIELEAISDAQKYLNVWSEHLGEISNFHFVADAVVEQEGCKGKVQHNSQVVQNFKTRQHAIRMSTTYFAPYNAKSKSISQQLLYGREACHKYFNAITTEQARAEWGLI